MHKMLLAAIVVIGGAWWKYNFDKKYILPVVEENEELSTVKKWIVAFAAIAVCCFFVRLYEAVFVVLLVLVPFVLYLNFKSYWLAFKKNKK